ncbi:hypothetical protein F4802DRAFT_571526 [Xylaria palmicola]|nr:hypothetical protein F4802DRAFT_571526 [Xylaria palmicola]
MSRIVIAFPLLVVALIGVAIYVQVAASTLSLPISTATTVLTILLPLFAAANIVYTPVLARLAAKSPTAQQLLLAPALHVLQGGLVVVLATLAAQGFAPGPALNCGLEGSWQRLWHTHDGRAIQRIQDAFECCGFHSVRDRAWPPDRDLQCSVLYDRHTACDAPWRASMQRTSGLQFAVAVLAGIIQLAHLVYLRRRAARDGDAQDFRRLPRHIEQGQSDRLIEEPYHDGDDEVVGVDDDASEATPPAAENNAPRVEPSGLGRDEANEWRS